MASLTYKEQAFLRAILLAGVSTQGTRLARIMGIDVDRHTRIRQGFIGNHAVQLGKRPFAIGMIGLALQRCCTLPFSSLLHSLSNVGQVLKTDERMRIALGNALADDMIRVLLQPSLIPLV